MDGCSVLTIELILETTSKSCMRSLMSWARFSAICLSTLLLAVVVVEFVFVRLAYKYHIINNVKKLQLKNSKYANIHISKNQIFNIRYQNIAQQKLAFLATPAKIPPGWFTIRAKVPVLVPSTTFREY